MYHPQSSPTPVRKLTSTEIQERFCFKKNLIKASLPEERRADTIYEAKIPTEFDEIINSIEAYNELLNETSKANRETKTSYKPIELTSQYLIEILYHAALLAYKGDMDEARWNIIETILDGALNIIDPKKYLLPQKDTVEVDLVNISSQASMARSQKQFLRLTHILFIASTHIQHTSSLSVSLVTPSSISAQLDGMLGQIFLLLLPKNITKITINCNIKDFQTLRYYMICCRDFLSRNAALIKLNCLDDLNNPRSPELEAEIVKVQQRLYEKSAKSLRRAIYAAGLYPSDASLLFAQQTALKEIGELLSDQKEFDEPPVKDRVLLNRI